MPCSYDTHRTPLEEKQVREAPYRVGVIVVVVVSVIVIVKVLVMVVGTAT